MTYELIKDGNIGVIIDPTPILRDIKDTFAVSFVLPGAGAYVALFRDESGVEYRTIITDGIAKVPKQLLTKEQRIGLTVCKICDDAILYSWVCQTLKVGTFLSLRQTQWQITAGVDDKELYTRIAELERSFIQSQSLVSELMEQNTEYKADFNTAITELRMVLDRANETLSHQATAIETLTQSYNNAIAVINNLSERITALESNYDPTVIK